LVLDSRKTQIKHWSTYLRAMGKTAPVILVINKIDQQADIALSQSQLQKAVPNLKQICHISCATQHGMNELHAAIQATLPQLKRLNLTLPVPWLEAKTALMAQARTCTYLHDSDYRAVCQAHGIDKPKEQQALIMVLHELGSVTQFAGRWLDSTYILRPQWLIEALYHILSAAQASSGRLDYTQLHNCLNPDTYPMQIHDYLWALMERFGFCYALNETDYLFPNLLPAQAPAMTFDDPQVLYFTFNYAVLPDVIFPRVMVALYHHINNDTYWRDGMLLRDDRCYHSSALVKVERAKKRIDIYVSGQQRYEYLAVLRFVFDDIHRSMNKLTLRHNISLPDDPAMLIDYDDLVQRWQRGETQYVLPDIGQTYQLADLLGGIAPHPVEDKDVMALLHDIHAMLASQMSAKWNKLA